MGKRWKNNSYKSWAPAFIQRKRRPKFDIGQKFGGIKQMKHPNLTLYNYSNADIIAALYQIQITDEVWLKKQFEKYNTRDPDYQLRLDWASKRFDFLKELLCRLEKFNWIPITSAIDIIFEMHHFNVDPSKCHFTIEYCGLEYPKFHLHK